MAAFKLRGPPYVVFVNGSDELSYLEIKEFPCKGSHSLTRTCYLNGNTFLAFRTDRNITLYLAVPRLHLNGCSQMILRIQTNNGITKISQKLLLFS